MAIDCNTGVLRAIAVTSARGLGTGHRPVPVASTVRSGSVGAAHLDLDPTTAFGCAARRCARHPRPGVQARDAANAAITRYPPVAGWVSRDPRAPASGGSRRRGAG